MSKYFEIPFWQGGTGVTGGTAGDSAGSRGNWEGEPVEPAASSVPPVPPLVPPDVAITSVVTPVTPVPPDNTMLAAKKKSTTASRWPRWTSGSSAARKNLGRISAIYVMFGSKWDWRYRWYYRGYRGFRVVPRGGTRGTERMRGPQIAGPRLRTSPSIMSRDHRGTPQCHGRTVPARGSRCTRPGRSHSCRSLVRRYAKLDQKARHDTDLCNAATTCTCCQAAARATGVLMRRTAKSPRRVCRTYRIATGLMIAWTEPVMRACPSTNMNSQALSATRGPVFMFSRMYTPLLGSRIW